MSTCAVILCGGRATRMGAPKERLIRGDGKTLLQVQADRLAGCGFFPVALSGEAMGLCPNLPRLPDATGLEGPLAGLMPALVWNPGDHVLVLAVDHGALTAELLMEMKGSLKAGRILAPKGDHGFEATACFWPKAMGPELERYRASGQRSIQGLLAQCQARVDVFPIPPDRAAAFANWNGPEDLPPGWRPGVI